MRSKIKRVGVFTSGGDSPGMNAAIRAVTRAGICNNMEVIGIRYGYEGMINGDILPLDSPSVSNIIQRGGTILKSARSKRFMNPEGRKQALQTLRKHAIDALVAIGGDGTFRGAAEFMAEYNIPVIGIPGTIDNDLFGTDFTIGYDTAINTVVEAIDKIRDTADSHNRLFFIEVMGRDAGFIALRGGIAGGAEAILVPETTTLVDEVIATLESGWQRHKMSSIVVVAEGDDFGGATEIATEVKRRFKHYETRVTILGHIQRGGSPTAMDRILGSRLGVATIEALINNKHGQMAGIVNNKIVFTPFAKATKHHVVVNRELLRLADILSI